MISPYAMILIDIGAISKAIDRIISNKPVMPFTQIAQHRNLSMNKISQILN